MSTDRFDEILGQALKKHSEPVPADFTYRMLRQISCAQQREILARFVLQERLALAGCIIFGIAVVIALAVFPDTIAAVFRSLVMSMTQEVIVLTDKIPHTIRAFSADWQSYTILTAALGFAVYCLVELFRGDDLKTI